VVATMEVPASHHATWRPETKYSSVLRLERRRKYIPRTSMSSRYPAITAQSRSVSVIFVGQPVAAIRFYFCRIPEDSQERLPHKTLREAVVKCRCAKSTCQTKISSALRARKREQQLLGHLDDSRCSGPDWASVGKSTITGFTRTWPVNFYGAASNLRAFE